ncbi:MAG: methionyl-tRNA formyltransferase [Halanaerobiales bacterium]|nr:methionyl-tRNA formyltransferase [Halanaerobiales bacterium]
MNVVFAGTPDFAVPSLETLSENDKLNIKSVITQPDRKRGRGKKVQYPPVKKTAKKYDLKVIQPKNINDESTINKLEKLNIDLLIVVAYGQILSKKLLDLPKYGCINLHASLLSEYRGSSPIQQAILDGKEKTGVTTMFMDEGLDTGDIIKQREVIIKEDDNAGKLHDRLASVGAKLLEETILDFVNNPDNIKSTKQDDNKSSYTSQLSKDDGLIDWSNKAEYIKNFVRAMNPWPGSFTYLESKLLKVYEIEVTEKMSDKEPGTIIKADPNDGLSIQTGDNIVKINELQLSGKKRMKYDDFLRGYSIKNYTKLKNNK